MWAESLPIVGPGLRDVRYVFLSRMRITVRPALARNRNEAPGATKLKPGSLHCQHRDAHTPPGGDVHRAYRNHDLRAAGRRGGPERNWARRVRTRIGADCVGTYGRARLIWLCSRQRSWPALGNGLTLAVRSMPGQVHGKGVGLTTECALLFAQVMIYMTAKVSGGKLNPAVTLGLLVSGSIGVCNAMAVLHAKHSI